MNRDLRIYVGAGIYSLLVLGGAAVLGFVVAPQLAAASGFFPIDADARGFFSLVTLKGAPYLVGLGILSALVYPRLSSRPTLVRAMLLCLNILVAWSIAASIALATLG